MVLCTMYVMSQKAQILIDGTCAAETLLHPISALFWLLRQRRIFTNLAQPQYME
jgi:hypothetical protein